MASDASTFADSRGTRRVLLVGWDGADARTVGELQREGGLRTCTALADQGAMGDLVGIGPPVASLAWSTIATGMRPDRHGILDDAEFDVGTGGWEPVSVHARRVHAVWNLATLAGIRSIVVGWVATHPAEPILGACVNDRFVTITGPVEQPWPIAEDVVHPGELAASLADLRLHPSDIESEELRGFVPSLGEIDLTRDLRPLQVAEALARTVSLHAVATDLLETEDWRLAAIRYPLLGHLAGTFLRCRPPGGEGVPDEDVRHYGGVIDAAYRLLDAMLARLRDLAGPDTTVILVSEGGVRGGTFAGGCPRPTGLIALAGPDTRPKGLVHGANHLDLVPTVLAQLGLPAGADMPGRCLDEAFTTWNAIPRIPTWETLPGNAGRQARVETPDSWDQHEAIRQLSALGYATIDPMLDVRNAAIAARAEFHRAIVHLDAFEWAEAVEPLRRVLAAVPGDMQPRLMLALALSQVGAVDECRMLADGVPADSPFAPHAEGIRGLVAMAEGRQEDAVEHLIACEQDAPPTGFLLDRLGMAYIGLDRFDEAMRVLQRSKTLFPESALAPFTLAGIHLHCGRPQEAAAETLHAVARRYRWPEAHVRLGIALAQLGRIPEAVRAFEVSIAQRPSRYAHEALARLFERSGGEMAWIEFHRARANELRRDTSES